MKKSNLYQTVISTKHDRRRHLEGEDRDILVFYYSSHKGTPEWKKSQTETKAIYALQRQIRAHDLEKFTKVVTHDVHTEGYPEEVLDFPIPAVFLHVKGESKPLHFNGTNVSPYFLFNWIHKNTK